MNYKFNMSYDVKIKLKDKGYEILISSYKRANVTMSKQYFINRLDKDGYYEMQFHHFMSTFGEYLTLGFDIPIEIDILFSSDDLDKVGI